jgi:ribosome maturation factor RimP
LTGTLSHADEEKIIVQQEIKEGKLVTEKLVTIPYEEIERAFVMVSFK